MWKIRELKNAQNNCSFTGINFCDWVTKIFPQPSFWKCRISPHQSSTDKLLIFITKLHNSYNLFSAHITFPLHVVLFVSKKFNLNVQALLTAAVCHKTSIARFNIIMKVGYRPSRNSRKDYLILLCRHYRRNV